MEPITAITTALGLAKSAGEITDKLNKLYRNVKDRETKEQIATLIDQMHVLKQSAYALEDENRSLREQLRFKGDDYEFSTPFYYEKAQLMPRQALCPKCFSEGKASPMGERGQACSSNYRKCLVCGHPVQVSKPQQQNRGPIRRYGGGGDAEWMG